jgi:hypothetical protein
MEWIEHIDAVLVFEPEYAASKKNTKNNTVDGEVVQPVVWGISTPRPSDSAAAQRANSEHQRCQSVVLPVATFRYCLVIPNTLAVSS